MKMKSKKHIIKSLKMKILEIIAMILSIKNQKKAIKISQMAPINMGK